MSKKEIKIDMVSDNEDQNHSKSTIKKPVNTRPKAEFKRKVQDDVEYQEYLITKFRLVTKKCLNEIKKEDFVSGFAKLDEGRVAPENTEGFYKEFTRLIESTVDAANWFLKNQNYEKASEVLEKAFKLVKARPYTLIECFLNIRNCQAMIWKGMQKYAKAMSYLQKAENILDRNQDIYSGTTYLNMSCLYSLMRDLDQALRYSLKAINHCEKELLQTLSELNHCTDGDERKILNKKHKDCGERLAIAYFNYGREVEYKNNFDSAIDSYGKALSTLDDLDIPCEKIKSRISKARALAMEKKVNTFSKGKTGADLFETQMVAHDELDYTEYRKATVKRQVSSGANMKKTKKITYEMHDPKYMSTLPIKDANAKKMLTLKKIYQGEEFTSPKFTIKKNNFVRKSERPQENKQKLQLDEYDGFEEEDELESVHLMSKDEEIYDIADIPRERKMRRSLDPNKSTQNPSKIGSQMNLHYTQSGHQEME